MGIPAVNIKMFMTCYDMVVMTCLLMEGGVAFVSALHSRTTFLAKRAIGHLGEFAHLS